MVPLLHGTSDSGRVIEPNDPNWDRLQALSRKAKDNASAWLSMDDVYGDVGRSPVFVKAFSEALGSLWSRGTTATIEAYLAR